MIRDAVLHDHFELHNLMVFVSRRRAGIVG
jgi:hypothetical protein